MKKPEQELAEIKSMMERSTRFLSLSGLSGVLAGIYALIGAYLTWNWVYGDSARIDSIEIRPVINSVLFTAAGVLMAALASSYLLSWKKGNKTGSQLWSPAGRRFLSALFIPVISGGLFSFALLHQSYFQMIPGTTLIFYGLGLINASNHTLSEVKNLGYGQLAMGLTAIFLPDFGLICWAVGFGVLHIIHGTRMYFKYDR